MTDSYGIPDNMFGVLPDELPATIGRIVMLGAVVEEKILQLAWALAQVPQTQYRGKQVSDLVKICRRHLDRLDTDRTARVQALLVEAERAMRRRNDVVHSLWPAPKLGRLWGWRHAPRNALDNGVSVSVKEVTTSETELRELITTLVRLVEEINNAIAITN